MPKSAYEMNFDGLVGPTHNYSGLSFGNIASLEYHLRVSNPKEAALQGLAKMQALMSLGIKQGVLPPHERPFLPMLRRLGYTGSEQDLLHQAWQKTPEILLACSSSANMWAANAATICPSADAKDGKVHITPANLVNKFHRSFEAPTTSLILRKIFPDPQIFLHHDPLPSHSNFSDEGAANHTRLCPSYGKMGIQLFVFGRSISRKELFLPEHFPARQTLEASQAIARLHQLRPNQVIFAQQNPEAIDAGVFHNDVISVGNENAFFYHEKAFVNTSKTIEILQQAMQEISQSSFHPIEVTEHQISLQEAVKTYLFNSQLISLHDQMALIAPRECQYSNSVSAYLKELLERSDQPIKKVIYQDVRESMQNGGGPACLRLRVVLTEEEWQKVHPAVILTPELYVTLVDWVKRHYRDRLTSEDLADPQLLLEGRQALDELSEILQLGSIYSFQKERP